MPARWGQTVIIVLTLSGRVAFGEPPQSKTQADSRLPATTITANAQQVVRKLEAFQALIGDWRGVGQPKRGSAAGAWRETAAISWHLQGDLAGLNWSGGDSRLWSTARLTPGQKPGDLEWRATLADGRERVYRGSWQAWPVTLQSEPEQGVTHQLTLRVLGPDRFTITAAHIAEGRTSPERDAEVGFQRQGTRLASGDGGPECVVTGGKGTIAVEHQGKTYYVCCTGCRDAFLDDPAGIIAAWEMKRKAAKPVAK